MEATALPRTGHQCQSGCVGYSRCWFTQAAAAFRPSMQSFVEFMHSENIRGENPKFIALNCQENAGFASISSNSA